MSRPTINFSDEMDLMLEDFKNWAANPSNGLSVYRSKKDLIQLALEIVTDLYVKPFQEDPNQTYLKLNSRYRNIEKRVQRDETTRLLNQVLRNQELQMIIAVNDFVSNPNLSVEDKVREMTSYLTANSEQNMVMNEADSILSSNIALMAKQAKSK